MNTSMTIRLIRHTILLACVLQAGLAQSQSTVKYVQVVTQADPGVAWPAPATMSAGTPLGGAQLNATANTPGTFTYSPAAGTVLAPGVSTLSASFVPANPNFTGWSGTVRIDAIGDGTFTFALAGASPDTLFPFPTAGSPTAIHLLVTPAVSSKLPVTVACGAAPTGTLCSVSPASVSLASGPVPVVVTLENATVAQNSGMPGRHMPPGSLPLVSLSMLGAMAFTRRNARWRGRLRRIVFVLALLTASVAVNGGCGGTVKGTWRLNVTASSPMQTSTVTIRVGSS
jgi:hypothetical protein